jgi:trehalose 6-phosphate phosphatase
MVHAKEKLKPFFTHLDEIEGLLSRKRIFILLDYDGTLTPIVATPDLAVLSSDMHDVIKSLSQKHKISIVSGRATDDVRQKVNIEDIYYAGSHGFEIIKPNGDVVINEQAKKIRSVIDEVHRNLEEKLSSIEGALVEHVKYTISTHYRLVNDQDFPELKKIVEEVGKNNSLLRITNGKKVFEIRPDIDWHKGKAVEFILKELAFNPAKDIAVYIGDDTTDEDAFKVVETCGFGIIVSQDPRETEARFIVKDVGEVKKTLEYLLQKNNL